MLVLSCRVPIVRLALTVLTLLAPAAIRGGAQAPAPPANPQAPVVAPLSITGVQPGQTAELTLKGSNLAGPTGLSAGFPCKTSIPTDAKNGQDNATLKVRLEVPKDAALGAYPLRLATRNGVSNVRLLCVDELPQIAEDGKNRARTTAQVIPVPCVVMGTLTAEAAGYFKFTVAAGQALSFDLLGRRLGSAADAQLTITHAKTGRELAYDNDSPGVQGDPRLRYTFKEAGEYIVEIKDVLNRGGAEYFYRLRLGDFPLANAPVPMALQRGSKTKITFTGPFVEGTLPVEAAAPAAPDTDALQIAPRGPNKLAGWPVTLMLSNHDERAEQEPNNERAKANRVPIPGGVTGRFQQSDDTDCFVFTAKKGQKLRLEARTLERASPSLVYLVLKNAKGAELAKSNPQAPPPTDQRIDFTPGEDGDVTLEVQHLNFVGGPSEAYHLTIRPAAELFELSVPADRFEQTPGGAAAVPVQVTRGGYTGPIELAVVGPPGLTATATVKAGQTVGMLLLPARADQPLGLSSFAVIGRAKVGPRELTELASARAAFSKELGGVPYPPPSLDHRLALAARTKLPFALTVKMTPAEASPGVKANVTISVQREPGFTDAVTINAPTGLPPNVPAPKVPAFPKGKNEVTFPLDLNAKAPLGEYYVLFSGKAKLKTGEIVALAPPLAIDLAAPFALKVEPAALNLKPGTKVKLKVTATRRAGYKGPIALDVRKLPANVSAAKVVIAADKNTVELDIAAAPNAAPADVPTVEVAGTATALNNFAVVSPPFTVRVQKK